MLADQFKSFRPVDLSKLFRATCLTLAFVSTSGLAAMADDAEPQEKMQTVVIAKVDLAKGTVVTQSNLDTKDVPARFAPMNAVSGTADVIGRTMKVKKEKGQIILIDDLLNAGDKLD